MPVADLLDKCSRVAFTENLHVDALVTDGWYIRWIIWMLMPYRSLSRWNRSFLSSKHVSAVDSSSGQRKSRKLSQSIRFGILLIACTRNCGELCLNQAVSNFLIRFDTVLNHRYILFTTSLLKGG